MWESFLCVYVGMRATHFKFQNQAFCKDFQKAESLPEKTVRKIFLLSSVCVFFSFLALKINFYFNKGKPSPPLESQTESDYALPLLVNLKGEKGPQLARIHVHIHLKEDSLKKEFLSQDKLEKHLLFILSGQSIKTLHKKRVYFEEQIRAHLNGFLTKRLIHGVYIQTEILN